MTTAISVVENDDQTDGKSATKWEENDVDDDNYTDGDDDRTDSILDDALKEFVENLSQNSLPFDLSSMGLDRFPKKILMCQNVLQFDPLQVTSISLDYNDIYKIPSGIKHLRNLSAFSINGNNLDELPGEICTLTKLEVLSVNENDLGHLPESIGDLWLLKRLSAIGNQLSFLPSSLSSLQKLEELYLDENMLVYLPKQFGKLRNLQILELSNNMIASLPDDFGSAEHIKIVNLNDNKITILPDSLCDLQNLEALDLSNNNLKELPSRSFSCTNKIKKLYLENNNLKVLPPWCGNMPELEELFISDNALTDQQFNDEFCMNCTKLRILEAGANFMESLSWRFGELKNLEVVHFGSTISELERSNFQNGNWMKCLPESFANLTKLLKANINENQIHYLPEDFGNLSLLTWLDLGQNMIKHLPPTFCQLVNIEFLQLSKNLLEELPDDIGNLRKLIELRLDDNLIETIPESLGDIQGLQALDLFRNRLTEIPSVIFKLKKLTRLDLDQNNFTLSLTEIPKIVPGLKYPKRDPSLKDNWRGKSRVKEDSKNDVVDFSPSTDCHANEADEEEEIQWNSQALKMAISRGTSFWRSHTDASESRTIAETRNAFNEDEDWVPITRSGPSCDELSKDPCEEDWDEEIAMNQMYTKVKETCEERKTKTSNLIDAFQSSVNRYPPAVQAYSATANYSSFVYKSVEYKPLSPTIENCSNGIGQNVNGHEIVEGQFDDAD